MRYTAVIRTLGTAGEKYQRELDSLMSQTIPPEEIIVYIAEGYPIPKETCGRERYVYVKKGMVAQRALPYDEVKTEWMLMLDDDIYLYPRAIESLFKVVLEHGADVVGTDIYPNANRPLKSEVMMTISGRMRARRGDKKWGYKVMRTGGYSYNKSPGKGALLSQTNAGGCFICRKKDFVSIGFNEELWLDKMPYALGDDQVMFYKMYLNGLKLMTLYNEVCQHLDAGGNIGSREHEKKLIFADYYFRQLFFDRFILKTETKILKRVWSRLCIGYFYAFGRLISIIKREKEISEIKSTAYKSAKMFIKTKEYKVIPLISRK